MKGIAKLFGALTLVFATLAFASAALADDTPPGQQNGTTPPGMAAGGVRGTTKATGSGPQGGVLGAQAKLRRTAAQGKLPFTGAFMWQHMLVGMALLIGGIALRRHAEAL